MATQTTQVGQSDFCSIFINWDDATLLASSVSLSNGAGVDAVSFFLTVAGVTQSVTANPGAALTTLTFLTPLPITVRNGKSVITGMNSMGFGVGVSVGVL